jgi:hypothetical protein
VWPSSGTASSFRANDREVIHVLYVPMIALSTRFFAACLAAMAGCA